MTAHRVHYDLGMALANAGIVLANSNSVLDVRGRTLGTFKPTTTGPFTFPNVATHQVGTIVYVVPTAAAVLKNAAGSTFATCVSGLPFTIQAVSTSAWAVVGSPATNTPLVDGNQLTAAGDLEEAIELLNYNLYGKIGGASAISSVGAFTSVDLPLNSFRETSSGDVGNTAGGGGVLSSNTTPVLEGAGSTNAQRISWATGNVDPIVSSVTLPLYADGTIPMYVRLIVASAGTTNGWTKSGGVITNWDGGADVSDDLTDTASATVHAILATVAASDIPDSPLCVSVTITPPTHATDILYLLGARLIYTVAEQPTT